MMDQEHECINIEVVWLFCMRKHDIIKIKCTDRKSRYKNIYREMREELKRVIGRRDVDL